MKQDWSKTCDQCDSTEFEVKYCLSCESWLCPKCWSGPSKGFMSGATHCLSCLMNLHKGVVHGFNADVS